MPDAGPDGRRDGGEFLLGGAARADEHQGVHAGHRPVQGGGLGEVTDSELGAEPGQWLCPVRVTDQGPYRDPAAPELPDRRGADLSRCTGHEDHRATAASPMRLARSRVSISSAPFRPPRRSRSSSAAPAASSAATAPTWSALTHEASPDST